MSSWRKNGQDLAQTSRKWRKKILNGESDGERKIYPSANPEFFHIKVGFKGVYISRTCFPDVETEKSVIVISYT